LVKASRQNTKRLVLDLSVLYSFDYVSFSNLTQELRVHNALPKLLWWLPHHRYDEKFSD
jgi:hypothetical protein